MKVAGYTEGRCLVGGLINIAQTDADTLVAASGLILAMWRDARLPVISAAWSPCPVCHYADLEPSGQGLCCRRRLLWLC